MNTTFEINTYAFFPKIDKMRKMLGSNCDYIALAFELSFKKIDALNPKKRTEETITLLAYLLVDHYIETKNKSTTAISFDILSPEEESETFCLPIYSLNKINNSKSKKFEIDSDSITIKKISTLNDFSPYQNISEAITSYVKNDIFLYMDSIEPFIKNNNIEYEKENCSLYFKDST